MISLLVMILCIYFLTKTMNNIQNSAIKDITHTCPPHSWRYQSVYNEDGSLNHQHLVCDRCGPLHGVTEND